MAQAQTALQEPPRLPTLAEIEARRAELLAYQAAHHPEDQLEDQLDDEAYQDPPLPPPPKPAEWPTLPRAALHGLAGLVVRTIAPHTEADPVAVLLQFLAAFGNVIGPGPHCMVESTRHALNLFVVLVGESSKARKGTSWGQISRLFSEVDDLWVARRVISARLSADGLIHALRDQAPATDRRLLALSEEFAGALHVLGRQNGHLSPLLRSAWDSGHLRTLDRHHALQATGTHISLIGHITQHELSQHLHRTDSHNGFANRCLWTCIRRSQCLPEGSSLAPEDLAGVARELRSTLNWVGSQTERPFCRDAAARELWNDRYPILSRSHPGLYGAATSRAEAQVLRLSAIYAALDCTPVITTPHLEAALAVWEYCSASAAWVFSPSAHDDIADRIREALDVSPDGLKREQIRMLFQGHVSSERIDAALQRLTAQGVVNRQSLPSARRPSTLWVPVEGGNIEQE